MHTNTYTSAHYAHTHFYVYPPLTCICPGFKPRGNGHLIISSTYHLNTHTHTHTHTHTRTHTHTQSYEAKIWPLRQRYIAILYSSTLPLPILPTFFFHCSKSLLSLPTRGQTHGFANVMEKWPTVTGLKDNRRGYISRGDRVYKHTVNRMWDSLQCSTIRVEVEGCESIILPWQPHNYIVTARS